MSNFDKMIKLIEEKDIKGMEEWLHPDFLFVVDYEMETREEWLKDTKQLFSSFSNVPQNLGKKTLQIAVSVYIPYSRH